MIARGLAVLGLCLALATAAHGSVRAGPLADAGAAIVIATHDHSLPVHRRLSLGEETRVAV